MNWAYLAGFTDGDGCITRELAKETYGYARIRWAQKASDSQVLDEIAAFLDSEGITATSRNFSISTAGHKYPQRELALTNAEDTRKALIAMQPYLVVKRERCAEALHLLQQVHDLKARYGWKYRVHLARELAEAEAA